MLHAELTAAEVKDDDSTWRKLPETAQDIPRSIGFQRKTFPCHVEVLDCFGLDVCNATFRSICKLQVEIKAKLLLLLEVGAAETGWSVFLGMLLTHCCNDPFTFCLSEAEPSPPVRRKIADCVQSTGNQLIDLLADERPKNIQQWPELMPTLMRIICETGKDSGVRADCLWTVKD